MSAKTLTETLPAGPIGKLAPLYVDLDGTLMHSDMLFESALRFVAQHPWKSLLLLLWALRGPAVLKARLAPYFDHDLATLPWNRPLLEQLRREASESGRVLVLATATHELIAQRVAQHLGIFSAVLATTDTNNLKSGAKLAAIQAHAGGPFAYAGNDTADLPIWKHAASAVVVSRSRSITAQAQQLTKIEAHYAPDGVSPRVLLRALRVHQWSKNLLVFAPLFAAHLWNSRDAILAASGMFLAFSLCASAIYLINDLLDLPSDRAHPRKHTRPMAAGRVSIPVALLLAPLLLIAGGGIAVALGWLPALVLAAYVVTTTAYSFVLKRIVLVDVITLASLYTVRVIGGAAAIGVVASFWILALSMFLFLSLALIKRYSELHTLALAERLAASGRDYTVGDRNVMLALGIGAGFSAVMVMALFLNSPGVAEMYPRPYVLWGLCVTLLYWIARMWVKASRGEMHDDPLVYAATDRASLFMAFLSAVVVAVASWPV
jgi:4-hydroxybenzoate polyprenyltransferase